MARPLDVEYGYGRHGSDATRASKQGPRGYDEMVRGLMRGE